MNRRKYHLITIKRWCLLSEAANCGIRIRKHASIKAIVANSEKTIATRWLKTLKPFTKNTHKKKDEDPANLLTDPHSVKRMKNCYKKGETDPGSTMHAKSME